VAGLTMPLRFEAGIIELLLLDESGTLRNVRRTACSLPLSRVGDSLPGLSLHCCSVERSSDATGALSGRLRPFHPVLLQRARKAEAAAPAEPPPDSGVLLVQVGHPPAAASARDPRVELGGYRVEASLPAAVAPDPRTAAAPPAATGSTAVVGAHEALGAATTRAPRA